MLVLEEALNYDSGVPTKCAFPAALYGVNTSIIKASGYETRSPIAVITVEPPDKISFVYNCMHTRLRGQYNGK